MNKTLRKFLEQAKQNYLNGFITREEYLQAQRKVNRLESFKK